MEIYNSERQQVVDLALKLSDTGYLMATGGNLSIRIKDKNAFVVTPSNFDYRQMKAEDVCVLDMDLNVIDGKHKPSIESALHAAIYRTRPDVNAIVHTHQVYASALALINQPIPALFDEQVRFLGRSVEIIPYGPSGTGMLKNKIEKHVRSGHNAYIMQNHGALCFGEDAERASHNVEILEKCSIAYLLALCTEKKVGKIPLPVREIAFSKLRKDQKRISGQDSNTP